MDKETFLEIQSILSNIKGGYTYSGIASYQVCFPLKAGGELRFGIYENDDGDDLNCSIDLYEGDLPPGIYGPVNATG